MLTLASSLYSLSWGGGRNEGKRRTDGGGDDRVEKEWTAGRERVGGDLGNVAETNRRLLWLGFSSF